MLLTTHKIISYSGSVLWFALAILTVGGILLSTIGWGINVVVGVLFALIGSIFLWRAQTFRRFYNTLPSNIQADPSYTRFLLAETLLILGTLLFVGLLLSMAIFRVFGEGAPVFS